MAYIGEVFFKHLKGFLIQKTTIYNINKVMTIAEADELNLDSSYQFLINCVGAKTNFLIDAARCGNEVLFVGVGK
jgi:hypothetical protein